MKKNLSNYILAALTLVNIPPAYAQQLVVQYDTELQYDMEKRVNWVNLLSVDAGITTSRLGWWKNGTFSLSAISIFKTLSGRLADDRLTFSNIEEDNMPFNLRKLGYTHTLGNLQLFGGLRSVNEDYFTSPFATLYTNSSCGIYPTLSCNYPIANYPLSAICLHIAYNPGANWSFRGTLYNGIARKPFEKGASLFAFRPAKDGLLCIAEIGYSRRRTDIRSGAVCNVLPRHAAGKQQRPALNGAWWATAEQSLATFGHREISLMAQLSFAPANKNTCSRYYGGGIVCTGLFFPDGRDTLALFFCQAHFSGSTEAAAELTWKCTVTPAWELQPALHLLSVNGTLTPVALFRAVYTLRIY